MANKDIILADVEGLLKGIRRGDTKIAAEASDAAIESLVAGRVYPFLAPDAPLPANMAEAADGGDEAAKMAIHIGRRSTPAVRRAQAQARKRA